MSMLSAKVMPYLLRLAAPLMDSSIVHWTQVSKPPRYNPDILSHTSRHKEVSGWSQDRTEMIEESPFSTYTEHSPRKRKKMHVFASCAQFRRKHLFHPLLIEQQQQPSVKVTKGNKKYYILIVTLLHNDIFFWFNVLDYGKRYVVFLLEP